MVGSSGGKYCRSWLTGRPISIARLLISFSMALRERSGEAEALDVAWKTDGKRILLNVTLGSNVNVGQPVR
jgi:hypothetical protein